jgi:hypothetical protein
MKLFLLRAQQVRDLALQECRDVHLFQQCAAPSLVAVRVIQPFLASPYYCIVAITVCMKRAPAHSSLVADW